jgi:hypothetical protein
LLMDIFILSFVYILRIKTIRYRKWVVFLCSGDRARRNFYSVGLKTVDNVEKKNSRTQNNKSLLLFFLDLIHRSLF